MQRITAGMVAVVTALVVAGTAQTKPTVLVSGSGNISINSDGIGVASATANGRTVTGWAASQGSTTINKHDQTMEMSQNFLRYCPHVELTLDETAHPDYYVLLNREGQPTMFGEIGKSQVMVVNARKSPVFVLKKGTVKNAVRGACNAIIADWQAHGRLAPAAAARAASAAAPALVSPAPAPGQATQIPQIAAPASPPTASPTMTSTPEAKKLALVLQTTAKADKYCKPDTIATVRSDTIAYLLSKGFVLGTVEQSNMSLVMIIDRPIMKWIQITVQARDHAGNVLWSEEASDGGWSHTGGKASLNVLDHIHNIIDTRFRAN